MVKQSLSKTSGTTNATLFLLTILTALLLSACGGGGSANTTNTNNPAISPAEPRKIDPSNWQNTQLLSRKSKGNMQIERVDSKLHIKVTNIKPNSGKHIQIFLDTDNNPDTGYQFDNVAWSQSGVDYIIEDGYLFRSTADNSAWSWDTNVGDVTYLRKAESIEVTIDTPLLEGLCSTLNAGVMSRDKNWNIEAFYPASRHMKNFTLSTCSNTDKLPPEIVLNGTNPIRLPLNATFNDPGATAIDNIDGELSNKIHANSNVDTSISGTYLVTYKVSDSSGNSSEVKRTVIVDANIEHGIIIDGNPDDWAAIQPLAQTKQGVLKVFDDEDKLYLLIETSKTGKNTQFFLDSDNNPQTGFQLGDQAWKGGADYMIENRSLGKAIGNTFQWAWDFKLPSSTEYAKAPGIVEVAVYKSDLKSLKNTISIGYISRNKNWGINYIVPEDRLSSYKLQSQGTSNPVDARDDSTSTLAGQAVTIDVLANDKYIGSSAQGLTIVETSQANNGDVTIQDNKIVYTPEGGFSGTDSFSYIVSDQDNNTDSASVTIEVTTPTIENQSPIAQDDSRSTSENQTVTVEVLQNDSDPDDDSLSVSDFTQAANGVVALSATNVLSYTPNNGFSGTDSFNYTISDGKGGTDTATVNITVESTPNRAPDAVEDAPGTANTQAITINVLENDTDPDGDTLTVISITQPTLGTATLNNDGTVLFDPQGNVGSISFSYTISDGRGGTDSAVVTIASSDPNDGNDSFPNITGENVSTTVNTPVFIDVLANDTDADGDVLVLDQVDNGANGTTTKVNGGVLYTPNPGFTGTDSFFYGVHDGHGHNGSGQVFITVTP